MVTRLLLVPLPSDMAKAEIALGAACIMLLCALRREQDIIAVSLLANCSDLSVQVSLFPIL